MIELHENNGILYESAIKMLIVRCYKLFIIVIFLCL